MLLSGSANLCEAATYLIDPVSGNNAIPAGPWSSLQGLNIHQGLLQPGDEVLLLRGHTYHGFVQLNGVNGTMALPIVIGAYGAGSAPVISGSDLLDNSFWTDANSDGLWEHPGTGSGPTYLFDSGTLMTAARYPDTGWLRTETNTTNAEIRCSVLPQAPGYWNDGTAVVRTANWSYNIVPVQSHISTGLTFNGNVLEFLDSHKHDWGFFILGSRATDADANGEWVFENNIVHYRTGTQQPDDVEAAVREYGLFVNGGSWITVRDLVFEHFTTSCIYFNACNNPKVEDCEFRHSKQGIGCAPPTASGHQYLGNSFHDIYNQAINAAANGSTIADNTLTDIGMIPGLGNNGYGGQRGMLSAGSDCVIERNALNRIGYSGMDVKGDGTVVKNNLVNEALASLNDGGGIAFDECDGMVIEGNIVQGLNANEAQKLESSSFTYYAYYSISFGIYYGNLPIKNLLVKGNTVSDCSSGIHVDHTICNEGNRVHSNTLFNNRVQLSISDNSNDNSHFLMPPQCLDSPPYYMPSYPGEEYVGNICYSLSGDQKCVQLGNRWATSWSGAQPLVDFGLFKNNFYFNAFSDIPIWFRNQYSNSTAPYVGRTLTQWQSFGKDLDSHVHPLHLKDYGLVGVPGAPTLVLNGTFDTDAGYWDWPTCWPGTCVAPTLVQMNGSQALRSLDCAYVEEACDPQLGANANAVTSTDFGDYLLTFRMRADEERIVNAGIQYLDVGQLYVGGKQIKASSEPRNHEVLVSIAQYGNLLGFKLPNFQVVDLLAGAESASAITLDNVEVKPVVIDPNYPTQIAQEHLLLTWNPLDPNSTQSYTLAPGCWSDVYGNIYSGSVTIANEYESVVLFKLSDTYAISNGLTLTQDETWTQDQNVKGSIVIPSGVTLTVDGATIGFADSRLDGNPVTNVVVQPGGTLKVINGGLLTSVPGGGCVPGMWDGVKNLGNGTGAGGGLVEVSRGGAITNAFTAILAADGDPELPVYGSPGGGGQIVLDYAVFENNQIDVFRSKHTGPVAQLITNSAFRTTRALNYPTENPKAHYVMYQCGSTTFTGCTFGNYRSPLPADPIQRGVHGILGIETNVFVDRLTTQYARNRFENLFIGVGHGSLLPSFTLAVDECDFVGCARSSWIIATDNVLFTENTIEVPETGTYNYDYGTYMYNCTGFEFEENVFTGAGSTTAKVGSVFSTCGPAYNLFYNNRYDGFTGNGPAGYSAGAIVSGNNRETGTGLGFTFKCNDFSNTALNDHDLAFTDAGVTVGSQQGSAQNNQSPAGNTFANGTDCMAEPDKHFYVEDGNVSTFEYWHHSDEVQIELVPDCASPPIVTTGLPGTWYQPAGEFYDPNPLTGSCPTQLSQFQDDDDEEDEITYAHNEAATLRDVYDDWSDGGDPTGLIDFINDPANSSYDVRNQLMLIAPKVSDEAWKTAFTRNPAMNPWHLAQALMANSPLTPEVIEMMTTYNLGAYYRQLVNGAQNGGVSMHSIYRSEIAYWRGRHARALRDLTASAIHSGDPQALANAFDWHGTHGTSTSPQSMLALSYALGDDARARQVVDAALVTGRQPEYWDVQDLYLTLRENAQGPQDVDVTGQQMLEAIATSGLYGAGHAQVWLSILGQSFPDHVVLPQHNRAPQASSDEFDTPPLLMQVQPNPSKGPVAVSLQLPEGADGGAIRVLDPLGRQVYQTTFTGSVQIVEIDTREMANGVYLAEVQVDGIQLGVTKFELAR